MKSFFLTLLTLFILSISVFPQNNAVYLDGNGDYVNFGNADTFNLSEDFTIELWAEALDPNGNCYLLSKGGVYFLHYDDAYENISGNGYQLNLPGTSTDWWEFRYDIDFGEWNHIAVTYESSGKTLSAYMNGNLVRRENITGNISYNTDDLILALDEGGRRFKGTIDGLRIWDYVRSESDIQSTMNTELTGTEPGLISLWCMNEGSGSTAIDSTENKNDGTLFNDAVFVASTSPTNQSPANAPFSPVRPTGLPYNVVVTDITINGDPVPANTQVGIYDGTLCVGAGVWDGTNLQIIAWEEDAGQGYPGFTSGNAISFKVRIDWYSTMEIFNVTPTFTEGDGNFGTGTYSSASLAASTVLEPDILLSDNIFNFNAIELGDSRSDTLVISNTGNTNLDISNITTGYPEYALSTTSILIPPGGQDTVIITFSPTSVMDYETSMTITSDDPDEPSAVVTLNGTGLPAPDPQITVTPLSLYFGGIPQNTSSSLTFNVLNKGNGDLVVSDVFSASGDFVVSGPTSFTLAQFENQDITVDFTPSARGAYSGTITVNSNDGNINVSAYGIASDGHFPVPESTGKPYNIIVKDVTIDSIKGIKLGDEIAVYDGALCVGVGHLHDSKGIDLDGSGDYVSTGLDINQDGGDAYTFEAWIYPYSTSGGYHHAMSTDNGGYDWSLLRSGGTWSVFTGSGVTSTGVAVQVNTWQHIALVFEPSQNRIRFYFNGLETIINTIAYDGNDNNFNIGRNPGYGDYFDGIIDEVMVWKRALTKPEIENSMYMKYTGTEDQLVGYWTFDDATAGDLSTGNNNGSLAGNAEVINRGALPSNIQLIAWEKDDSKGMPGFTPGNPMGFKVWTNVYQQDFELDATPDYIIGDGTFGYGQYSSLSLTANTAVEPNIHVSASSLYVGQIEVNQSITDSIIIFNTGDALLEVDMADNSSHFSVDKTDADIAVGDSLTLYVTFSPTISGNHTGTLTITSNDPDSALIEISLEGFAVPMGVPDIAVSADALQFGGVITDDSLTVSFNVINTGTAPLDVTSIASDNPYFTVQPTAFSLENTNNNQMVDVTLSPDVRGLYTGTINITSNASAKQISLRGVGYDGHFDAVDITGLPYSIIVDSSNLFDHLSIGDEIAVFDDTLCVGSSAILQDTGNIQIISWRGDSSMGLPGFTFGHNIAFRVWTKINGFDSEFSASSDFKVGDGTFNYGQYSVASLLFSAPVIQVDPSAFLVALNEPDSATRVLLIDNTGEEDLYYNVKLKSNNSVTNLTGQSVAFDGSNDYISTGNWSPGTSWTLEAWVKPSGTPSGRHSIVGAYGGCDDWGITMSNGYFGMGTRPPGGCSQTYTSPDPVVVGEWTHVAATYDGDSARLYIDGKYTGSQDVEDNHNGYSYAWIGAEQCCGNYFPGLVDEVRIWDYPRSATEILSEMGDTLAGTEAGLLAYYPFDDGTANDKTGNHNGSFHNGAALNDTNAPFIRWLELSKYIDTVPGAQSDSIILAFKSAGLLDGLYEGEMIILNNTLSSNPVIIPVSLNVSGDPQIKVSTDSLVYGQIIVGEADTLGLNIQNIGSKDLAIDSIYIKNGTTSGFDMLDMLSYPLVLSPVGDQQLEVAFAPSNDGLRTDTMMIMSNDSSNLVYKIVLKGDGQTPPDIDLDIFTWSDTLISGNTQIDTLIIRNLGQAQLTFSIAEQVPWLSVSPQSGNIGVNDSVKALLNISAIGVYAGNYTDSIIINTNDYDEPSITFNMNMLVVGYPQISVPGGIDFGNVDLYETETEAVPVVNTGTDTLFVDSITLPDTNFIRLNDLDHILPGQSDTLHISFTPDLDIQYSTVLTLYSDAVNDSIAEIIIQGKGIKPQEITVTPTAFTKTLSSGSSAGYNLNISNSGVLDLTYDITIDDPAVNALDLDGNGDYVNVISNPVLNPDTALTIEAWIYLNDNSKEYLVAKEVSTIGNYRLFVNGSGKYQFTLNTNKSVVSVSDALTGQWVHLAASFDGSAMRIFINGSLDNTEYFDPFSINSNNENLRIGRSFASDYFNGQIDEFRIWNVAKNQSEIQTLINLSLQGNEQGLVLYYQFNESGGNLVQDASPSLLNGTLYGDAVRTASGITLDDFLTLSNLSGVVGPTSSRNILCTFNAGGLINGTYNQDVTILSNDQDEPEIVVPAILNVTGNPVASTSTDTLLFDDTFYGFTDTLTLTIENTGADYLELTNWNISGSDFILLNSVEEVIPFSEKYVQVVFLPLSTGTLHDTLTVGTNDPVNPVLKISLEGNGVEPPVITLSDTLLDYGLVTLPASVDTALVIKNTGASPLQVYDVVASDTGIIKVNNTVFTLDSGDSNILTVTFIPDDYILFNELLIFHTNIGTDTVALTGSGIKAGNDVGVISLFSPTSGCGLTDSNTVRIRIRNFGSLAQTNFDVGYIVNNQTAVVENIDTTSIPSGAGKDYTFDSVINMSDTGVYELKLFTLLATDQDSVNDTLAITLYNYPVPEVIVSDDQTICSGESVTLNAAATQSGFIWNTGSNNSYINVSPSSTTSYSVTATDIHGCKDHDTIEVNVLPLPTAPVIAASGATTICVYDSVLLTSDIENVTWNHGPAGDSVFINEDGDYQAINTDTNGCPAYSNMINVSKKTVPELVVNGVTTICKGDYTSLTVDDADEYLWSTGDTIKTISVAPENSKYFYVTMTTSIGCIFTDSVYIYVIDPVPPGQVGDMLPPDASLDVFKPINFSWSPAANASNYDIYIWNTLDSVPASPTIDNLQTINYTYNASGLDYGNTYEWMVVSRNSCYSTDGPLQTFSLRHLPDLTIDTIQTPSTIYAGQPLTVTWETANKGMGSTNSQQWKDAVYLSLDTVLSDEDIRIGTTNNLSYLVPGQSYSQTATFDVPGGLIGNYYVLVTADEYDNLHESNESNNYNYDVDAALLTITVQLKADLIVNSIGVPSSIFSGNMISVNYQVANTTDANAQGADAKSFYIDGDYYTEHYWYDAVYISEEPTFNAGNSLKLSDVYIGLRSEQNPDTATWYTVPDYLAGDSVYSRISQVTIPHYYSGTYYIYVLTDSKTDVDENAENNNVFRSNAINVVLSPPPDLVVDTLLVPSDAKSGETLAVNWTTRNKGGNAPQENSWRDKIYISKLDTFNINQATLLGNEYILGGTQLDPDEIYSKTKDITLPHGIFGDYYVYVHTDANNDVFEYTFDDNNISRSLNPIEVDLAPYPDLVVDSVFLPDTVYAESDFTINWQGSNQGTGIALSDWTDRIYISSEPAWNPANAYKLSSLVHNSDVVTGAGYSHTVNTVMPDNNDGLRYIYVFADVNDDVYEYTNENNNVKGNMLVTIDTTTSGGSGGSGGGSGEPDTTHVNLALQSFTSPSSGASGSQYTASWTVKNTGTKTTTNYWYDYIYLSNDSVLDENDNRLSYKKHDGQLLPGESYTLNGNFTLPNGIAGNYYLIISVDHQQRNSTDTARNNNLAHNAITVSLTPPPDLVVNSFNISATLIAGQQVEVPFTINNNGTGSTRIGSWQEVFYISTTPDLGTGNNYHVGTYNRNSNLANGSSYTDTINVTIPNYLSGFYYFIAKADGYNRVYEHNDENNNVMTSVIQITIPDPADLVVSDVNIPSSVNLGEDVSVSYTVKNIGPNQAIGNLSDAVYFSDDKVFDSRIDKLLKTNQRYVSIDPGDSVTSSLLNKMPGVVPGWYHGIGRTNLLNSVIESNINNNINVTDDTMNVTVNELLLDIPDTFGLDVGDLVYYKVNVDQDLDLIITLTSNLANGSNEVYVAFERVPTTNDFDYLFDKPNHVNQQVLIPSTQKGDYYILVKTPTNYHGLQETEILARALPFSILSINPDTVGTGIVTTKIDGAGFRNHTKFYLLDQDSSVVDSAELREYKNSMQVVVRWDFTNDSTGTYHVKAQNNDTSYFIKENGLVIEESTGFLVDYNYISPSTIRLSGRASFSFFYENIGNVDIPYIKADYTVPTYTNLNNMSTVGDVYKRSELSADTALGYLNNWVDYDNFRHIPVLGKDLAPGESMSVSLTFRGFGNSSVFPMRVRAYGYNTEGYLLNQLNMAEGIRSNMSSDLAMYGVDQNADLLGLVSNPDAWRDSILSYQLKIGLIEPSDTAGFDVECPECTAGFGSRDDDAGDYTYDPGLSPGIENYITTAFDAGEDYMWEINNYNGLTGTDPGWDLVKVSGRLDITTTVNNPFIIRLASINYENEPDYLAGWYPGADKCWPIAIADGGIFGFDTNSFVLDVSGFTNYNDIYNGSFSLRLSGTDTLMLCFNGDPAAAGVEPSEDHQVSELPEDGIPCGSIDNLGQSACDYVFSTIGCAMAEYGAFNSFVVASGKSLANSNGPSLAVLGSATSGLGISNCKNPVVDSDYQSPASFSGVDLLGCSNFQQGGGVYRVNCAGQFICTQVVKSCDPNDIIGPRGFGDGRYVSIHETLPYTIRFENDSSFATTAAQRVTITQKLDDNIDPLSFRVKDFGFADHHFDVNYNTASYFNTIDMPDELGYDLEVTAGIDISTNEAFWVFQTIDPKTGLPPTNPLLGFLAVNDSIGSGEGFVNYSVKPSLSSNAGDSILAEADIVFDINEPIITPEIFNRIDKEKPYSFVDNLPSSNDSLTVPVNIIGSDEANGSGINHYKLFVSKNDGKFRHIGDYLPGATIPFAGEVDDTYGYFSIAVDNVGHVEPMKYFEEAEIVVKLGDITMDTVVSDISCYGAGDGYIELNVTGGEKPYSYLWSNGDTNAAIYNLDTGYYSVTVTDMRDSVAMDTFMINEPVEVSVDLGNDTTIPYGGETTLSAGPFFDTYLWSDSSFNSTLIVDTAGIYWVEVAVNGCWDEDTISVTGLPPFALPNDTVRGCPDGPVLVDAGAEYDTYNWSNGDTTQVLNAMFEGLYYVTVTNAGFAEYDSVYCWYYPATQVDLGPDISITESESITLHAGTGFIDYRWSDNSADSTLTVEGSIGVGSYNYDVVVTDQNGCTATDDINIDVTIDDRISLRVGSAVVSVYPNPTTGILYVNKGQLNEDLLVRIISMTGQTVYQNIIEAGNKNTIEQIDLNQYPNAIYFMHIGAGDKFKKAKIVKY